MADGSSRTSTFQRRRGVRRRRAVVIVVTVAALAPSPGRRPGAGDAEAVEADDR